MPNVKGVQINILKVRLISSFDFSENLNFLITYGNTANHYKIQCSQLDVEKSFYFDYNPKVMNGSIEISFLTDSELVIGKLQLKIDFSDKVNNVSEWHSLTHNETNENLISFLISFNIIVWTSKEDNSIFSNTKPSIGDITCCDKYNFNRTSIGSMICESNPQKKKTLSSVFNSIKDQVNLTKIEEINKKRLFNKMYGSSLLTKMENRNSLEFNLNSFEKEKTHDLDIINSQENYYEAKKKIKEKIKQLKVDKFKINKIYDHLKIEKDKVKMSENMLQKEKDTFRYNLERLRIDSSNLNIHTKSKEIMDQMKRITILESLNIKKEVLEQDKEIFKNLNFLVNPSIDYDFERIILANQNSNTIIPKIEEFNFTDQFPAIITPKGKNRFNSKNIIINLTKFSNNSILNNKEISEASKSKENSKESKISKDRICHNKSLSNGNNSSHNLNMSHLSNVQAKDKNGIIFEQMNQTMKIIPDKTKIQPKSGKSAHPNNLNANKKMFHDKIILKKKGSNSNDKVKKEINQRSIEKAVKKEEIKKDPNNTQNTPLLQIIKKNSIQTKSKEGFSNTNSQKLKESIKKIK